MPSSNMIGTKASHGLKALNLISALQSTSGLGVRPAGTHVRTRKTRSLYSAKLTANLNPNKSATLTASSKS